jgi:hypothetical protein
MRRYRVSKLCLGLVAGLALGMAMGTFAGDGVPTPAAKIDSGLGELTEWREPRLNGHAAEKVHGGVDEAAPSKSSATTHAARTTR